MTRSMARGLVLTASLVTFSGCGQAPPPLVDGLGDHRREVATASEQAQRYFDQGLCLYFSRQRFEAERSFRQSVALDSECAMCWWGVALSLGPSVTERYSSEADRAESRDAIARARRLDADDRPGNRLLIEALGARYEAEVAEQARLWPQALADLRRQLPEDADVAALYAEALMLHAPPGDPSTTERIREALDEALAADPDHPGALALAVVFRRSEGPEAALPAAERLRAAAPGAGGVQLLSGYLYLQLGRYADAAASYAAALEADTALHAGARRRDRDWIYRSRYAWGLGFAEWMRGRERQARQAVELAAKAAPSGDDEATRFGGAASFFRTLPLLAAVRFGHWDRLLDARRPSRRNGFEEAIWRFARGMALTRESRLDDADRERQELVSIALDVEQGRDRTPAGNALAELCAIAEALLNGEIARGRGEPERAIAHYLRGVGKEDRLLAQEPPDWPIPGRHYVGAEALAGGRTDAAERVFRFELVRHPGDPWALLGLRASLEAQGRNDEAAAAAEAFDTAWTGDAAPPTDSRW